MTASSSPPGAPGPAPRTSTPGSAIPGSATAGRSPTRAPRWVYAFAIAGIVAVLVIAILHLTGLAPHGHHQ
jgi:hypothetical protein